MTNQFKWKNQFAENVFRLKYAQGVNDNWPALARRLVEDVCGTRWGILPKLMSDDDRGELTQNIIEQKFVPAGRYLYYGGRDIHFYNNCLSGDTEFITARGIFKLKHQVGNTVWVLSPITGEYVEAIVKSYGRQQLYNISLALVKGYQHTLHTVQATENHRWVLDNGTITDRLRTGDVIAASNPIIKFNKDAFIHGLVFADGNIHTKKKGYGHQLRLCGTKNQYVDLFTEYTVTYPDSAKGDACIYIPSDFNMKELPKTYGQNYIANFINGWLAGDSHNHRVLHTISEEAIHYFKKNAPYAGYVITSDIKCETRPSNYGIRKPLYYIRFQHADEFSGFKVKSITPSNVEEVYCVEEPKHTAFTLSGGISSGNCFCLRAEEDTREEWGRLLNRASDCLMSGGGIGVDYSRLRPSGRTLRRTGGISSGPLPLMQSVNEVGRNVMQGGSRRSAIFASLNWQHEDIWDFLKVKDWSEEIKALKAKDFNFPAPLDMTNMSIGWDTDFAEEYLETGKELPKLWYDSVTNMCRAGEPGHMYNFYDNEEDVLRNACTEFTSEDDSDVCNLGSINMGNISTIDEFRDVVNLASKFLICGTIRSDVPYEKVKEVREKNRKIGLGLMGIHEWLLKRGYAYEMNDELKQWLEVYRDESERAAKEHCDRFYLNSPKKFRAIAPAGSIGILASTTTGIEPLFAVAYKRRYLQQGTKWKYEYVIDSTAKHLIETCGVDPEKIETALTLANDPERRIKFQFEVQKYVDMAISSTLNLPAWGTKLNNETTAKELAKTIAKYCHGLRGLTVYPDSSRGGQPLTSVDYQTAVDKQGIVYAEEETCSGGICGV